MGGFVALILGLSDVSLMTVSAWGGILSKQDS